MNIGYFSFQKNFIENISNSVLNGLKLLGHNVFINIDPRVKIDILIIETPTTRILNDFPLISPPEWVKKCNSIAVINSHEYGWNALDNIDTHKYVNDPLSKLYLAHIPDKDINRNMREFCNTLNKPPIIFYREKLINREYPKNIVPLQYSSPFPKPAYIPFSSKIRNAGVSWIYGRSNENRIEITKELTDWGWSNIYTTFMIHSAYGERYIGCNEYSALLNHCKASIAFPGCGRACFKETEIIPNCLLLLYENEIDYHYRFTDLVNCIKFGKSRSLTKALDYLVKQPELCEQIYKNAYDQYELFSYTGAAKYFIHIMNNNKNE